MEISIESKPCQTRLALVSGDRDQGWWKADAVAVKTSERGALMKSPSNFNPPSAKLGLSPLTSNNPQKDRKVASLKNTTIIFPSLKVFYLMYHLMIQSFPFT